MEQKEDRLARAFEYTRAVDARRNAAKKALRRRLVIAVGGGVFNIDHSLIAFVGSLITVFNKTSDTILDSNQNPIEIRDLPAFHTKIVSLYREAINAHSAEMAQIRKAKTTDELVT